MDRAMTPARTRPRRAALSALVAFAAITLASPALADARSFTGRVVRVSANSIVVDNRMGDELSFARTDATRVAGRKKSWDALAKGDWVSVTWKFVDKPAKAYEVRVLPPRGDD